MVPWAARAGDASWLDQLKELPRRGSRSADVPRPTARGISGGTPNAQGSSPNTATLSVLATKTLPSATVGAMNLLPAPNWSRPLAAWLLL